MIKRLIYNLRKKPKESRDRVAFGVAALFTAVVCTVWIYHAPAKFDSVFGDGDTSEDSPTPFSSFFDSVDDQVGAVKESISSVSELEGDGEAASGVDGLENFMERNNISATNAEIQASRSAAVSATGTASSTDVTPAATSTSASEEAPRTVRIVTTKATATATSTQQ